MHEEKVHVRLLIVAGVALLWMTAIFGRLGYLQLIRHSEYLVRAQRQQQRTIEITPKRGAIYDRNMHPLAMSVPVESAFAVPSEIGDNKGMVARLLSNVLGVPREVLEARLESGGSFVWILRKLPPDKAEAVRALPFDAFILDGEILAARDGRILPFQALQPRLGRGEASRQPGGALRRRLIAEISRRAGEHGPG